MFTYKRDFIAATLVLDGDLISTLSGTEEIEAYIRRY